MLNATSYRLIRSFQVTEWASIIKGAALLSIGMVVARVLGMVFSLIMAAAFVPKEFGAIKYAITLGTLVAIVTQPFGQHVLARFIAKHKKESEQLQIALSNAGVVQLVLFLTTLLTATVILFILKKFDIGVLVVFFGLTAFYTYWGISRGFLAYGRLTLVYLCSNLFQLILVIILIYLLKIHSPLLAVIIYGASYFLPLALAQRYRPFPIRFNRSFIQKRVINEILRFSFPIWISHASYTLCGSIPIIFLEHFSGMTGVGVYSIAVTLAMIFIFVPSSISTLLMPKTSELASSEYLRLLKKMLILSSLINGGLLMVFLLSINWFVRAMFGEAYLAGISVFAIQALASILFGFHSIITAVVVGRGSPRYETLSRIVTLATTTICAWVLISAYGPMGAAFAALIGTLAGLIVYGVIALTFIVSKALNRRGS